MKEGDREGMRGNGNEGGTDNDTKACVMYRQITEYTCDSKLLHILGDLPVDYECTCRQITEYVQ